MIAAGVVLGGLGLLLSGVLFGSRSGDPVSAVSAPVERIERSVVSVELVRSSGGRTILPGLVLDRSGHILVADPLTGVSSVRVTGTDGVTVRALRVAADSDGTLGVVSTGSAVGAPATVAPEVPVPGTDVILTSAVSDGTECVDVVLGDATAVDGSAAQLVAAGDDPDHGLVFDRSGRLVGLAAPRTDGGPATAVAVSVPGHDLMAHARRLLGGG